MNGEIMDDNLLEKLNKLDTEKLVELCQKAMKIKNKKKVKKNNDYEESNKGRYRNEKCPYCERKAKKCVCHKNSI